MISLGKCRLAFIDQTMKPKVTVHMIQYCFVKDFRNVAQNGNEMIVIKKILRLSFVKYGNNISSFPYTRELSNIQ